MTVIRPISRRRALQLGGLGLAGVITGGAGLAWQAASRFRPVNGDALAEPQLLRSANGLLDVRLEAAQGSVRLAGRNATAVGYNGGTPGPSLHLQPGDRLRLELVNRLDESTNLHVHGLHVSPQGNGDNVFVTVQPGASRRYDYQLPADHPPGVFWYHPHHHGLVAGQISGGLFGAIIVGDPVPLPVSRERVLVVSDISLDAAGRVKPVSATDRMMGREGDLVLVNGQAKPRLAARPGARERWRVVNACTTRYLRLRLDGQHLQLLGLDSGRFPQPRDVTELVLAPGNRADLLVTTRKGTSRLRTLPYDRGHMMGGMGSTSTTDRRATDLVTVEVSGDTTAALPPVPPLPPPRDLRPEEVAARRILTLGNAMGMGMGADGMGFTIDGKRFDPDRVDQSVRVGTVEEWTLTNTSPMDHPFHLHVWPMQVIEVGGRPVDPPSQQDVVNVPARSDATVRIAFDDFGGRSVYHCHILDHEDTGMMGVIDAR